MAGAEDIPVIRAEDTDVVLDFPANVLDRSVDKRKLIVHGAVEDKPVAEIPRKPFAFHAPASPLHGVQNVDPDLLDHVRDVPANGAVAVVEDVAPAFVDKVGHPFHARDEERLDVFRGNKQAFLRTQVLRHPGPDDPPGDLLVGAPRCLIAQVVQPVEAVMDHLGIVHQIEVRLLHTAQPLVCGKGLRPAAADHAVLFAHDLIRDAGVVVPVGAGPSVIRLDLLDGIVPGQGMPHGISVVAHTVVRMLISDAEDILIPGYRRACVPGSHGHDRIDVKLFKCLPEMVEPHVIKQPSTGLCRRPIVHRDSVRLLMVEHCQPSFPGFHNMRSFP